MTVCGTNEWMSPEVILGLPYTKVRKKERRKEEKRSEEKERRKERREEKRVFLPSASNDRMRHK